MKASNKQPQTNRKESTDTAAPSERVYDLEERLLKYATRIIRLVDALPATRAGNHVGGQLLRSGTSPLPNHVEAQGSEFRADFIHKLKLCLKELAESRRWLRLIQSVPLIDRPGKIEPLITETVELIRIFSKSIQTAERQTDGSSKVREEADDGHLWIPIPPFLYHMSASSISPLNIGSLEFGVGSSNRRKTGKRTGAKYLPSKSAP